VDIGKFTVNKANVKRLSILIKYRGSRISSRGFIVHLGLSS
jgi:hypothetical protein